MDELKHANRTRNNFTNTRRDLLGTFVLAAAASGLPAVAQAQATNPGLLKSAGILAFGPDKFHSSATSQGRPFMPSRFERPM